MSNKDLEVLEKGTTKVFFKYTLLQTVSLVAISSAGIVDAYFVGQYVGEEALAAVSMIAPMYSFVFAIGLMLTVGSAVIASKKLGERNIQAASHMFSLALVTIVIFGLITAVSVFIFRRPIAELLGVNEALMPLSVQYLAIVTPSFFLSSFSYVLSTFIRVDNKPLIASFALTLSLPINASLDYIFIVYFDLGLAGAAYATVIAPIVPILIMGGYFVSGRSMIRFTRFTLSIKDFFRVCYLGAAQFVGEGSFGLVSYIFNNTMIKFAGPSGVAALSFVNYTFWGYSMFAFAVGEAMIPLISTNLGAGQMDRVKRFLFLGISFTFAIGVVFFILSNIFPREMVSIFLPDHTKKGFDIGVEYLYYVKWAFLLQGLNIVLIAYLTAVHRAGASLFISVCRSAILPVTLVTFLPMLLGQKGVYLTMPVTNALTLIIFLTLLFFASYNSPSVTAPNAKANVNK